MIRIIAAFIFLIIGNSQNSVAYYAVPDSVGIEKLNNNSFILYKVKKGETYYSVARKYGISYNSITGINNSSQRALKAGDVIRIPVLSQKNKELDLISTANSEKKHTVVKGESLYLIAGKYNTTPSDIIALNRLDNQVLSVGQTLLIPAKRSANESTFPAVNQSTSESKPLTRETKHKVTNNESLYSIAKKYRMSIDELKRINNLKTTRLALGQRLLIKDNRPVEVEKTNEIVNINTPTPAINAKAVEKNTDIPMIKHTVASGENLYLIAQQYNTTVEALKSLNNLRRTTLAVGQELLVSQNVFQMSAERGPMIKPPVEEISPPEKKIVHIINGVKEVAEVGIAGWIKNDESLTARKSIALHRNAPPGTVMKITNPQNGKSIFVKIVGNLPETGPNKHLLILVSKSVTEALESNGDRFPVRLSYGSLQ